MAKATTGASPANTVSCPKCGASVDVNAVLHSQIETQLQQQYDQQKLALEEGWEQKSQDLEKARRQLERDKAQQEEALEERVEQALKLQGAELEKQLKQKAKKEAELESADALKVLREELEEKSGKVKDFNKLSAEFERLKRDSGEMEDRVRAEAEKAFSDKLDRRLAEERSQLQKAAGEKYELTIRELEKQLEDQKKLTEEMQAKQEQGSMQLQGEVQELVIEEWLRGQFPFDTVAEVSKGVRGGDCIQTVHTRSRQNCGKIYYESKRTKAFSEKWIEKLRDDMARENANLGVIVTQTMPPDMERMGLRNGIWVCSLEEFKGLCQVLRESMVQISRAIATQENRGDKMSMLYDFLTSAEFKNQVAVIVEGFSQMQDDLQKEKKFMENKWKAREKQIQKILDGTTGIYGAVKGIAGNVIESVPSLELPEGEED
ncbi:MAG: DUF2130 domain-containing protein [Cyanophyceae cyanobacterium]